MTATAERAADSKKNELLSKPIDNSSNIMLCLRKLRLEIEVERLLNQFARQKLQTDELGCKIRF
jgi:hypothetical protein